MTHQDYMRQALALAQEAAAAGEVPVGASLWTRTARSLAGAATAGRRRRTPGPRRAGRHRRRLPAVRGLAAEGGPALRHPGALPHVRRGDHLRPIPEIYYGAKDAGFGACGSILNLFEEDFRHHPKIVGHILEAECAALLRDFFAQVREKEMQT